MTADQLHRHLLAGTVSHGTHRPQDLIPRFLDVLAIADRKAHALLGDTFIMPTLDDDEWWYSDHASDLLVELFDALDAASSDGMHFGAHEGDGSDFGYWESEETEEGE